MQPCTRVVCNSLTSADQPDKQYHPPPPTRRCRPPSQLKGSTLSDGNHAAANGSGQTIPHRSDINALYDTTLSRRLTSLDCQLRRTWALSFAPPHPACKPHSNRSVTRHRLCHHWTATCLSSHSPRFVCPSVPCGSLSRSAASHVRSTTRHEVSGRCHRPPRVR